MTMNSTERYQKALSCVSASLATKGDRAYKNSLLHVLKDGQHCSEGIDPSVLNCFGL